MQKLIGLQRGQKVLQVAAGVTQTQPAAHGQLSVHRNRRLGSRDQRELGEVGDQSPVLSARHRPDIGDADEELTERTGLVDAELRPIGIDGGGGQAAQRLEQLGRGESNGLVQSVNQYSRMNTSIYIFQNGDNNANKYPSYTTIIANF